MNKIVVRLAQKHDVKELAVIQTESWKKAFPFILSEDTLQKYTNVEKCRIMLESVFDSQSGNMYIAYLNDEPCGELFWCNAGKDIPEFAEIVAVHSLEHSWGKGLGKAMMDKALTDISANGEKHAFLWVFKDNIRACKFYEKCGFQTDGIEQISRFDDALEVKYIR